MVLQPIFRFTDAGDQRVTADISYRIVGYFDDGLPPVDTGNIGTGGLREEALARVEAGGPGPRYSEACAIYAGAGA
jgi:hypothetical protein